MRRGPAGVVGFAVALAVLASACGGGAVGPVSDPPASGPAGAIVEVETSDLPEGYARINLVNDILGYMRGLTDPVLADLAGRAREPGRSARAGFGNRGSDEFIFVTTVRTDSAEEALAIIAHLRAQPLQTIYDFVSPDDTLFEQERRADPELADDALHYFFRYGVESEGRRTRDVGSDLLIFARGGSVIFIQRSLPLSGEATPGGETSTLLDLGRTLSARIDEALAEGAGDATAETTDDNVAEDNVAEEAENAADSGGSG